MDIESLVKLVVLIFTLSTCINITAEEVSHASNVICNKCLQQVFPFTELEDDDFPKVFTASNQQQMLIC